MRRNNPQQNRPHNCRYYVEVRDGEDPMRAYRRIKKKMKDDKFVEQIKELNELYKSGAITKEEFEKAKKKLLN